MNRLFPPVLALTLLLTACAPQESGTTAGGIPSPSVASASRTPATSAAPVVDAALFPLEFSRSGGFAGFDDQVTVKEDGSMTITAKGKVVRTGKLDPAGLSG